MSAHDDDHRIRPPTQRAPRLLYLVTEDWYFWSHRLPMARAARDAGFAVTVATRVGDHAARIAAEGFEVVPLAWRRRSVAPWAIAAAVAGIVRVHRRVRPDIVHHVAMKPVLLGGIAARIAGVPAVVNALTGLGSVFVGGGGPLRRLVAAVARRLLRWVLGRSGSVLVLQNRDDRDLLTGAGLADPQRLRLIRGSGIDTRRFAVLPEPAEPPVVIAFVGRLLADKGVRTLVEAYGLLHGRGHDVRLLLAGTPDPENPTAIGTAELARWRALPGVELAGHVGDVRTVWARAHVAVLPSRREGLPKSLLEAAACGRAIVASDVPGCREVAVAGRNALLVPVDDAHALAEALETLVRDPALRRRFAAEGRRMVESDLAADAVGAATVALYRDMLAAAGWSGDGAAGRGRDGRPVPPVAV